MKITEAVATVRAISEIQNQPFPASIGLALIKNQRAILAAIETVKAQRQKITAELAEANGTDKPIHIARAEAKNKLDALTTIDPKIISISVADFGATPLTLATLAALQPILREAV